MRTRVVGSKNPQMQLFEPDPAIRLALAYARASDRPVFEDLFALDRRLADAVRQASEPIIAQLKLAWWRDRFAQSPTEWPKGEPLLERLAQWHDARDADVSRFGALVDGWEALLADRPFASETIAAFAQGRAEAWSAVALALDEAPHLAMRPALLSAHADLAQFGSSAEEALGIRNAAQDALRSSANWMPRALRPFAVLGVLGERSLRSEGAQLSTVGDFFAGVRAGMLGR